MIQIKLLIIFCLMCFLNNSGEDKPFVVQLDKFEKLEMYPIDNNYYILNKHTKKNWWSTICLKSIKSATFEIKIKPSVGYVYDVVMFKTKDKDIDLILSFVVSYKGYGICDVYRFNRKLSKLKKITSISSVIRREILFKIDNLSPSYEDHNKDFSKELVLRGWKSNGFGKYKYSKIILFKENLVFDKVIEKYSLNEKFEALLAYFALGYGHLGKALTELISICKNNEKVDYKKINEFEGKKYDVLRLLLSRYNKKVVCNSLEVINNIIQKKETRHYRYLYYLLESEQASKKLNNIEKKFCERYMLYLKGVIETLSDI